MTGFFLITGHPDIPLSPWPHRDPYESAQQSPWPKSTRPRPANQRGSVGENDIRQAMQLLYHMAIYIYIVCIYIYVYIRIYIYITYIGFKPAEMGVYTIWAVFKNPFGWLLYGVILSNMSGIIAIQSLENPFLITSKPCAARDNRWF